MGSAPSLLNLWTLMSLKFHLDKKTKMSPYSHFKLSPHHRLIMHKGYKWGMMAFVLLLHTVHHMRMDAVTDAEKKDWTLTLRKNIRENGQIERKARIGEKRSEWTTRPSCNSRNQVIRSLNSSCQAVQTADAGADVMAWGMFSWLTFGLRIMQSLFTSKPQSVWVQ